MPFQSEKQRRYLWANEPEIARDWTDTYGHKARGADGGVMRVPFQGGGNYSQNTAAQNMFGKMYHTLNPFEKFQINQAIDTYGPNEPGITASTGGGGGGAGGYIDPATISGPDILAEWKENIPDDWPPQRKKGFSEYEFFDEYLRDNPQLYQGIAQNLGRGIDKTRDTARNIYQSGKKQGRKGLSMLGAAYQMFKGSFNPLALAFSARPSFQYKGAEAPVGNYSIARQNQMNALGGYYSEPQRQYRRDKQRYETMLAKKQAGKKTGWSPTNFLQLQQQYGFKDPTPIKPPVKTPITPQPHQPTGPQQQDGGGGGGIPQVARDLGMRGSYDHGWT